jgi:rRNA maturation endonuclease Nob1
MRYPRWWQCRGCDSYWSDPHEIPCWSCGGRVVATAVGGPQINSQHSLVSVPVLDAEP